MQTAVYRHDRCEMCGNTTAFVIRNNNTITDQDIIDLKNRHPIQDYIPCEVCEMVTLHTTLAWEGIYDRCST